MPIYEYVCKKCGKKFEKLLLSESDNKIKCTFCGSEAVEKAFSSFSGGSSKKTSNNPSCPKGGCCPGCR